MTFVIICASFTFIVQVCFMWVIMKDFKDDNVFYHLDTKGLNVQIAQTKRYAWEGLGKLCVTLVIHVITTKEYMDAMQCMKYIINDKDSFVNPYIALGISLMQITSVVFLQITFLIYVSTMNEGMLVIVQDFIAIEVITLLDNFFGHLVLTILQQNHTFLLGNEPDDNLTDKQHRELVYKFGLPPDLKRNQVMAKSKDSKEYEDQVEQIKRMNEDNKTKKSQNPEVLPYNMPSKRDLDPSTFSKIN